MAKRVSRSIALAWSGRSSVVVSLTRVLLQYALATTSCSAGKSVRSCGPSDVERPVVARPVAVERVDDVEKSLVPRTHHPVGEDVGVRAAPLARDGVHALDIVGAHRVQTLVDQRNDVVLADPRLQGLVY